MVVRSGRWQSHVFLNSAWEEAVRQWQPMENRNIKGPNWRIRGGVMCSVACGMRQESGL